MVTVSLKNEVAAVKKEFTGDYQISEPVNGKPSWKSGEHAIWYMPSFEPYWFIGYLNKLGEDDGEFYAPYKNGGLTDNLNKWEYTIDWNIWVDTNDVIVSCSGGKESKSLLG